jgi:hypothetical protein
MYWLTSLAVKLTIHEMGTPHKVVYQMVPQQDYIIFLFNLAILDSEPIYSNSFF